MPGRNKPSQAKVNEVKALKEVISKYKTIGILDLNNLPSPQLQTARKKIHDVHIKVTKRRLLKLALKDTEQEPLNQMMDNVAPALIMTNDSSFKLAKALQKGRSLVAAKPGQVSPKDIKVSAGPTSLPPGPIIGDLGAVGIKASVEQGKVTVRQDCIVVREGDVIDGKKADILGKLGIKPIEIGLNLIATFENGSLFKKDVLEADQSAYINKIKEIVSNALNLSVSIGYVTKDNVNLILNKVQREALALDKIVNAERDRIINNMSQGEKEAEILFKKVSENNNQQGGN